MKFLITTLLFIASSNLYAEWVSALCDTIYKSSNYGCGNSSRSNAPGGSYPLLFDAFNTSPAALPTYTAPLGVEIFKSDTAFNFSLIKGFDGFGLGSNFRFSDITFFSGVENHLIETRNLLENYEEAVFNPSMTLGSAINILDKSNIFTLPIGLGYRSNLEHGGGSLVPGIAFKGSFYTFGASYFKDKPNPYKDNYYEVTETREMYSVVTGLKLGNLLIDYSYFYMNYTATKEYIGEWSSYFTTTSFTADYHVKTQIISATFGGETLNATYAYRIQKSVDLTTSEKELLEIAGAGKANSAHQLFGLRWKPLDWFASGLYYNYALDGGYRLLVQIYF
ncbi:MAG: hypothetical protein HOE90_24670 [Bacteriovoracaceae bacterium]|nr:hypothetical protein [Bacteriovoracaceae bacterium]